MTERFMFFDGQKAVSLNALPEEAWEYLVGKSSVGNPAENLYKAIPWFFRGVHLRANALAGVPWAIVRGKEDFETSESYENKLGWWPNPALDFYLLEASLTVAGQAYFFKERNAFQEQGLRYMIPTTVKPEIKSDMGLVGFMRKVGGEWKRFEVEDFLYLWLPDPWVELGPGTAPGEAALKAAGVLENMDEFVEAFFKRGAIKASVLGIKGSPPPQERERLRSWFKRTMQGVKNAFATEVTNADAITVQQIGEGVKELENSALTMEKREDISTAFGIPRAIMFSDEANRATSEQHKKNYYEETVLPEAKWVEAAFNEQIFEPLGLRLEFRPQEMAVFQEDEEQRAQSLSFLVGAGMSLQTAVEVLGFDLNDEQIAREFESEEEVEEQPAEAIPVQVEDVFMPPQSPPQRSAPTMDDHLELWRKKALNHLGKPKAAQFESELIPPVLNGAIAGALESAETEEDVEAVFADRWLGYP